MANSTQSIIDFDFPYEPYNIQREFMNSLYNILQEGKIGIFESPTGTGKSLSLICGALKWLKDFDAQLFAKTSNNKLNIDSNNSTESTDWVKSSVEKTQEQNTSFDLKKLVQARELRKDKYKKLRENPIDTKPTVLPPIEQLVTKPTRKTDDDSLSDDSAPDSDNSSEDNSDLESCRLEAEHGIKIIYCSRTHSQLSQFIHELEKTSYADSTQEINDRCLELRTKTKSSRQPRVKRMKESTPKGCPFSLSQRISQLRDQALSQPLDIESLVQKGRQANTCAYYASRQALKYAQLIVMPYQLLLHERTRKAIGLNLKGQIVILDEAHNLPEAISNVYSSLVTLRQLKNALTSLQNYRDRYQSRLNARNLLNVKQLLFVLQALITFLQLKECQKEEVISQTEFSFKAGIDHLNMFKLIAFCRKNKLSKKLMGFVEPDNESNVSLSSPLISVELFLESLCNFEEDGRIIVDRKQEGSIKFLLLNAGRKFSEAVSEVRALMIVGGTLEPIEEFHRLLLSNSTGEIERSRLSHFSCGHVVRKEQILPLVATAGVSNLELDFSFQGRTPKMLEELARIILQLLDIIPKGIVVFFPSYAFLSTCLNAWREKGFLDKINSKKSVFQEPRGTGVEDVLSAYTRSVELNTGGAIIFGVVGGKLSEGMNFSDGLARAVVMVGLPYPNIESPELKEKMSYLDDQAGGNTSTGRSIRHIGDYSCVLLLDRRYAREQVLGKLPSWLRSNIQVCKEFGQVAVNISKFYEINCNHLNFV
ncbi:ATP-dependent RNA helicase DDX11 isoform X2-like [Oopsacas minuta]|uniref:ATP-dependent RNA helicase DDX11 isoform X2-like n=1 Tax=Oopsacas minuta TaxID=111878 RepID=A0AAV7K194_9METZ|nr:ATP-dependent RNA helicase DDX11 isoform X2-like [Oopsacas minuta]